MKASSAFSAQASDPANLDLFDSHLRDQLDEETRAYWQAMSGAPQAPAHRDVRAQSLSPWLAGPLHRACCMAWRGCMARISKICWTPRTPREQRDLFNQIVAPLFESAPIKLMSKSPISLYALGIPPAQYDALVESGNGDAIAVLRERVERLACDFPIQDNYFAWQAFGRSYDIEAREAVPDYLKAENYATLKARIGSVSVHHASLLDFLREQPAQSLDRFVLLDAQDWMTPAQLAALWREIDRTAAFARCAGDLPHRGRSQSPAAEAAGRSSGALALS